MKKGNISIFVPHLGCPCQCSFCNQKTITGQANQPTPQDVDKAVKTALKSKGFDYEIAFFGGSFTAIDREYMISLLKAANKYIKSNEVKGIRISTRPDCIDEEILDLLKEYGVTSIELGAQSMDDEVLLANRRGHTAKDVENASELIKSYGFELGLQMMTGLYKDSEEKAIKTAEKIIALSPQTVRIYPTVVLKGTYLADLYLSGEYKPLNADESAQLCAKLVLLFEKNNIKIYPNPTRDIVNIESTKQIKNVEVVNMIGQVLYVKEFNSMQDFIDLSNLPTATYILRIKADDGRIKISKVIKK